MLKALLSCTATYYVDLSCEVLWKSNQIGRSTLCHKFRGTYIWVIYINLQINRFSNLTAPILPFSNFISEIRMYNNHILSCTVCIWFLKGRHHWGYHIYPKYLDTSTPYHTCSKAYEPWLARLSEIATADMKMLCSIFSNSVIATNERIIIWAILGFEEDKEEIVFYCYFYHTWA